MRDWFGNEYVESSWTRFVQLWQVIGFQDRRNAAFVKWGENVVARLKAQGHVVEALTEYVGNYGGAVITVRVGIPAIAKDSEVALSLMHYDTFTKRGLDPAKQVVDTLKWYARYDQTV